MIDYIDKVITFTWGLCGVPLVLFVLGMSDGIIRYWKIYCVVIAVYAVYAAFIQWRRPKKC